jgi:hypothetical protein
MFPCSSLGRDRENFQRDIRAIWRSTSIGNNGGSYDPFSTTDQQQPASKEQPPQSLHSSNFGMILTGMSDPSQKPLMVDGQMLLIDGTMLSSTALTSSSYRRYSSAISQTGGEILADGYSHYLRWGQWTQSKPRSQNTKLSQDIFGTALSHSHNDDVRHVSDAENCKTTHGYQHEVRGNFQWSISETGPEATNSSVFGSAEGRGLDGVLAEDITDEYILSLQIPIEGLKEIAAYYTSDQYFSLRAKILAVDSTLAETPINRYRRKIVEKIIDFVNRNGGDIKKGDIVGEDSERKMNKS